MPTPMTPQQHSKAKAGIFSNWSKTKIIGNLSVIEYEDEVGREGMSDTADLMIGGTDVNGVTFAPMFEAEAVQNVRAASARQKTMENPKLIEAGISNIDPDETPLFEGAQLLEAILDLDPKRGTGVIDPEEAYTLTDFHMLLSGDGFSVEEQEQIVLQYLIGIPHRETQERQRQERLERFENVKLNPRVQALIPTAITPGHPENISKRFAFSPGIGKGPPLIGPRPKDAATLRTPNFSGKR